MSQLSISTETRRGPAMETVHRMGHRPTARLPLEPVRQQIINAAVELIESGDRREVSAALANRFHTSEWNIDRVLVVEATRYQREAATLRTGVLSAMRMAEEAARDAVAEITEAA